MKKLIYSGKGACIVYLLLLSTCLSAQKSLLQSGPMPGYSTMKEVLLWAQTKQTAQVYFVYYDQENPRLRQQTDTCFTTSENAFVAQCVAVVEPGKRYSYELYINGTQIDLPYPLEFQSQPLWQWRGDPPGFRFAIGSCAYVNETELDRPGNPYGGQYEIFESIHQEKPDFMLWMGDNTYLREADWNSKTGILHRFTHTRSLPELQPLLGSSHHFAIWDDHDYGPNNSDRSFWNKEVTLEAFQSFWPNPNYGIGGGISGKMQWADVDFFLLDDRYFRSSPFLRPKERTLLGEQQLQWLIDALLFSQAPFKFVVIGSQVLNPYDGAGFIESYARYPEEFEKLLRALKDYQIPGVIFLTGDRHHTELTQLPREGAYPLYDLTISPLTAGAVGERGKEEPNTLRVPDTYYGQRNFAILGVSGVRTDRVLHISVRDVAGQEVWKKEIRASELK